MSYPVPEIVYSTFRVKVTPKRVKTTHVRSKIKPFSELKELFFRSKKDPKFGVEIGVKITPKKELS